MKHSPGMVVSLLLALAVAACVSEDKDERPRVDLNDQADRQMPDTNNTPERITVVRNNNQFAVELYAQLRVNDGNLFFSPYSISTALAMTYGGASGETAEQMAKTLPFTLPNDSQHAAFASLIKEINGDGKRRAYQMSTANALWMQKEHPFAPAFLKLAIDSYQAQASELNFAGDAESARNTINGWVEKQTHNKIKDLLARGSLTADTRLVLTNAIYFKGDWIRPFEKSQTKTEPFRAGAQKIATPLMSQTEHFNYTEDPMVQVLEMPYVGKEFVDGRAVAKVGGRLGRVREDLERRQTGPVAQRVAVLGSVCDHTEVQNHRGIRVESSAVHLGHAACVHAGSRLQRRQRRQSSAATFASDS